MTRKLPTLEEFEVRKNAVVHLPTDATWTAYPGHTQCSNFRPGMLGSILPNGAEYEVSAVEKMALGLLGDRPSLKRTSG
jgi:hypothetical protein